MASRRPLQRRVNRQQPAAGMLMIDGPGPPISLRTTGEPIVLAPFIRWALISKSEPEESAARATQRILLL